jgi:hypothetical protein
MIGLYETIILYVVSYGCFTLSEMTWIEGVWDHFAENNVWAYERKEVTGDWKKLRNEEHGIDEKCVQNVSRKTWREDYVGVLGVGGRLRSKWTLKKSGIGHNDIVYWIYLAFYGDQWRTLMNMVMFFLVSYPRKHDPRIYLEGLL